MRTILLVVVMLLVVPACMARQVWKTVGPPITAALDVDAQGNVVHAQLLGKNVLPQLQSLTEQVSHSWRFVPATVGGKPAPARTYAMFDVEMHEIDGNQQLRLHYMLHGPGRVFAQSPAYPPEMLRQLVAASVVMAFDVNGDGSVSNVHVVTAKTSGSTRGAAFYKASIEAIEKDRFLPELVDGRPVVTHMRMPINFDINGYVAGQLRHAPDAPHDKVGSDSVDVTRFADIPVALDSPLHLVSVQP
jgi:TonB family protein